MAAGALFTDSRGRILLVQPTYKDDWEIPGGVVERDESPLQACVREVREELGIDLPPSPRLLCIDWTPPRPDHTEGLLLIFDGGRLSHAEQESIKLPPDELMAHAFKSLTEAAALVSNEMARRLAEACAALQTRATLYLEDGIPFDPARAAEGWK